MRIDAWTQVVVYHFRWFARTQFRRKQSKRLFYRAEAQEKTLSLYQTTKDRRGDAHKVKKGFSCRSTANKDEFSADAHRTQRDFSADAQIEVENCTGLKTPLFSRWLRYLSLSKKLFNNRYKYCLLIVQELADHEED